MLYDIFTQEYGEIRLIVCMAPSAHDLQDTLNTMSFATSTRKVRTTQGPQNELEGLQEAHVVKLNQSDSIAVKMNLLQVAKENCWITSVTRIPELAELAKMNTEELSKLSFTRVKSYAYLRGLSGLGFEMSNGLGAKAGHFYEAEDSKLPARIHTIHTAFLKNECNIHSIKFEGEGDTVLNIGKVDREDDDDDWRIGRIETLKLEPDESLIGCEIYYNYI